MSNTEHPTFRIAVSGLPAAGDDSLTRRGVDVRHAPRPCGEGRLAFRTTAGVINLDLQLGPADAHALAVFFDPARLEELDAACEIAKAHPGLLTAMCAKRPTATGSTLADYGFKTSALALMRELTTIPALEYAAPAAPQAGGRVTAGRGAWADAAAGRPAAL